VTPCIYIYIYIYLYTHTFKGRSCFITIPWQLCSRICHVDSSGKPAKIEIKWHTSASGLCWY